MLKSNYHYLYLYIRRDTKLVRSPALSKWLRLQEVLDERDASVSNLYGRIKVSDSHKCLLFLANLVYRRAFVSSQSPFLRLAPRRDFSTTGFLILRYVFITSNINNFRFIVFRILYLSLVMGKTLKLYMEVNFHMTQILRVLAFYVC